MKRMGASSVMLQNATALENNCDAFLCNDKDLKRVTELKILILDEIEL